jgi:hypothetical protein
MSAGVRIVTVSPDVGSPDRVQGVQSTVDGETRVGLQLKDFSVDLDGNSADRRELDAADLCLGSEPNGHRA